MNRWMLMLGLGCWLALAAGAQNGPLYKKITVRYDNLPLAAALKDIGERTGAPVAVDEKLTIGADNVTLEVKDQEAGRVLSRILRPRGLKLEGADGSLGFSWYSSSVG